MGKGQKEPKIGKTYSDQAGKRGYPKGLYFLFFTEMWERFSYYGIRAPLIYYMTKHLMFSQQYASHVYGIYTGFVYFWIFGKGEKGFVQRTGRNI